MAQTIYELSESEQRAIAARWAELIRAVSFIGEIHDLPQPVMLSGDRMQLICGLPDPKTNAQQSEQSEDDRL